MYRGSADSKDLWANKHILYLVLDVPVEEYKAMCEYTARFFFVFKVRYITEEIFKLNERQC